MRRPPTACQSPGCGNKIPCDIHTRAPWGGRGTAEERGYRSNPAYLANRRIVMREETACALCGAPAAWGDHCDHKVPKSQGGTDDRSNLRRVCAGCNQRKAGSEGAAAARARR